MKISIIIPNYNGEKLLSQNLPKVLEAVVEYRGESEIIITDDASTDRSIEIVKKIIGENKNSKVLVRLLESDKLVNRGFSSNVNSGIKISTGEIVVLLNTDVVPNKDFLDPLLKHFTDEKVFAVGCLDESLENGEIINRGRGVGKWEKGFLFHSAGEMDKNSTLWVSGGSGAFRKSLWDLLGGLDSLYDPFYWEDIDISYRALKSGYKLIFEKNSIVKHEHDKGIIKSKYKKNEVGKIVYRNQIIFAWKNSDLSNLIINIVFLPYFIITTLLNSDTAFITGLVNAFLLTPRIFSSRKRGNKLFKINDKEIINNL